MFTNKNEEQQECYWGIENDDELAESTYYCSEY